MIAARPAAIRDEPAGEPLYQAVHGLAAATVADPGLLARELAARPDPVLRAEAFRLAREALHAGLLPPAAARALVAELAADVPAALRELAEPWAVLEPLPHGRVLRYLETGPDDTAVEVAARHGHRDIVRDVAADPARPPRVRRRALELLGDLSARDDVPDLLALAGTDPPLLAGPALACLTALHRRGRFPRDRDVPSVVRLALTDHRVAAEDVAIVLYTERRAALRELTAADDDAARRLDLLVALAAQGAPGLDAGGAVTALARRAADPVPYLRALRDLRHVPAEETVLDLLPAAPAAALDALEAVGGARTADALWTGLGLDGGEIVRHLRPHRHRALEILWHLTADPARRRAILDRLDPRDLPRRVADDLGGPDPRELAVLAANPDPGDPVDALCRLARNGDATSLPAIADLLLRVVSDLAATWGEGPEPAVPPGVVDAIRGLGGRLYRRGAVRPRCLLDAADEREAGHELVTDLALDLLDRPDLTSAEQSILLDLPCAGLRPVRARVHRLLRHRDPHVRKKAIRVLAGRDARALSASLIPLTRAEDPRTVRHALLALAEAHATWAAPAIAACLDHPNMNVKKTAAGALSAVPSPQAVPALLSWLARHDNPGFRDALIEALRATLRDAFAATVRAAAEGTDDARARARLLSALANTPGHPAAWLAEHGWAPEVARRAVTARATDTSGLRAMLPHWLDLAASGDPGASVLRFVLALCTSPWTDAELACLARSAGLLVDALPNLDGRDRTRLLDVLGAVIPRTGPAGRRALAARLHALPPGRDAFVLLHRCGDSPTRDELRRALAAARHTENPAEAETAILRATFARPSREPRRDERARPPSTASEAARTSPGVHPAAPARAGREPREGHDAGTAPAGAALGAPAELVARLREAVRSAADDRRLHAAAGRGDPLASAVSDAPGGSASPGGAGPDEPGGSGGRRGTEGRAATSAKTRADGPADEPVRGGAAAASPGPHVREHGSPKRLAVVDPGNPAADHATGPADRSAGSDGRGRRSSREWLGALIEVFPAAAPEAREELLGWMLELQPLGVPAWTIGEEARRTAGERGPRPDDLDQPWSAALHERLLRMLGDGTAEQRATAGRLLLERPEPGARLPVLRAYLDGRLDIEVTPPLARTLLHLPRPAAAPGAVRGAAGEPATRAEGRDAPRRSPAGRAAERRRPGTPGLDGAAPVKSGAGAACSPGSIRAAGGAFAGRFVRLAGRLGADEIGGFVPLLVEAWEHGDPGVRAGAREALRRAPADLVAEAIADRVEAGDRGMLDLVAGRPLLRTPALARAADRLRAEGRDGLAGSLVLVDGPLRPPGAARRDAETRAELRERR
ncbi:HEAT repeat domain-containing protein, partial [Actinomadura sediminis]